MSSLSADIADNIPRVPPSLVTNEKDILELIVNMIDWGSVFSFAFGVVHGF